MLAVLWQKERRRTRKAALQGCSSNRAPARPARWTQRIRSSCRRTISCRCVMFGVNTASAKSAFESIVTLCCRPGALQLVLRRLHAPHLTERMRLVAVMQRHAGLAWQPAAYRKHLDAITLVVHACHAHYAHPHKNVSPYMHSSPAAQTRSAGYAPHISSTCPLMHAPSCACMCPPQSHRCASVLSLYAVGWREWSQPSHTMQVSAS